MSMIWSMRKGGVFVARQALSDVVLTLRVGTARRPPDLSLALGFALGVGLSGGRDLDPDVQHGMIAALVKVRFARGCPSWRELFDPVGP